jgi:hypothetical protein
VSMVPSGDEILAVVTDWLDAHAKNLSGSDAYFARVATNAIAIVRRELALGAVAEAEETARLRQILGQDGTHAELNALLCARLRAGSVDEQTPGLLAHLKNTALRQIEIDQPSYRAAPKGDFRD